MSELLLSYVVTLHYRTRGGASGSVRIVAAGQNERDALESAQQRFKADKRRRGASITGGDVELNKWKGEL